jgi:Rod binding domain-containing protein
VGAAAYATTDEDATFSAVETQLLEEAERASSAELYDNRAGPHTLYNANTDHVHAEAANHGLNHGGVPGQLISVEDPHELMMTHQLFKSKQLHLQHSEYNRNLTQMAAVQALGLAESLWNDMRDMHSQRLIDGRGNGDGAIDSGEQAVAAAPAAAAEKGAEEEKTQVLRAGPYLSSTHNPLGNTKIISHSSLPPLKSPSLQ